MIKKIKLTQSKETFIDSEDYEKIKSYNWYYHSSGYAACKQKINNIWKTILLHRVIMNCPNNKQIDHINGNGLDNRKENLRICTHAENGRNTKKRKGTTSKYKGIYWYKALSKWSVRIRFNYKWIFIGYFNDEKEAAKAYNEKAKELFGKFAKLNIIG